MTLGRRSRERRRTFRPLPIQNRLMQASVRPVLMSDLVAQCQENSLSVVASRNRMTTHQLIADLEDAGVLGNEHRDPSPEEIRERARQIREEGFGQAAPWTEEQFQARWIGFSRQDGGVL